MNNEYSPYLSNDTREVPLLVVQQDDDDLELQKPINNIPKETKQKKQSSFKSYYFRDLSSGVIFLLHVFVVFCLAITSASSYGPHSSWGAPSPHQAAVLIGGTILLLFISAGISILWLQLLIKYSSELIGVVLWTMTGSCFLIAVFYLILVTDGVFTGILYLIIGTLSFFYALAVQDCIPFASAVLQVACLGLQVNMPGLLMVGIGAMVSAACWVLMWTAAYIGIVGARAAAVGFWRGGVAEPMLLLSLYWGVQVCTNVANVTTSGAVAEWWFRPSVTVKHGTRQGTRQGGGQGGGRMSVDVDLDVDLDVKAKTSEDAVKAALGRATTSSFGSICLGSFVVAILQTLRALTRHLRDSVEHHYFRGSLGLAIGVQQGGNAASQPYPKLHNFMTGLLTLLDWLLGILHRLASIFNRFAFVYVAVYGDDFATSGRSAHDLFRSRGIEAVVGDSLISNVLALGGMVSGAIVGLFGWMIASNAHLKHTQVLYLSLTGVVCGYGMCAVLMHGLVVSSVATVFVCFARDDIALKNHRPKEHELLSSAWTAAHPDFRTSSSGGGGNLSQVERPLERLNADLEADAIRHQSLAVQSCLSVGDKAGASYHRSLKDQHRKAMESHNNAASESLLSAQRIIIPQTVGTVGTVTTDETSGTKRGWGETIDLHGLFVEEAINGVNEFLDYHKNILTNEYGNASGYIELIIITGAGHHSINNEPKIRPAIQLLLEQRRDNHDIQVNDDNDNVRYVFTSLPGDGAFKVVISVPPESPVFKNQNMTAQSPCSDERGVGLSQDPEDSMMMFQSAAFESQELE